MFFMISGTWHRPKMEAAIHRTPRKAVQTPLGSGMPRFSADQMAVTAAGLRNTSLATATQRK
ncbi:hypothetical protein D3C80_1065190 [compost metagenome]